MAALWLAAVTTASGAAGLGNLAVHSALGEPFRAEIDLLSHQEGAPQPRLASADLYRMVGFRYHPALSGAQLQQRKHANGRNYVEITTERRIDEPFIHLLVELESDAVRVIRAYAVLLNPHGYRTPGSAPPAEYPPMLIPSATLAAIPAVSPPAVAKTRAPAAAVTLPPPPVAAAPAALPALDAQKLKQLEDRLKENALTLTGMLERVAVMEQAVKELRAVLEKTAPSVSPPVAKAVESPAAAPQPKPEAPSQPAPPPVAATQPKPEVPPPAPAKKTVAALPPRPERSWTESVLNEGLLILAGGALLLVLGLGYWMWGRAPARAKPGSAPPPG